MAAIKNVQVHNAHLINEFQLIQVMDNLEGKGITNYSIRPGNECIWVSYNLVDCYYIFRDGKIVDIQYD